VYSHDRGTIGTGEYRRSERVWAEQRPPLFEPIPALGYLPVEAHSHYSVIGPADAPKAAASRVA
jgi:hypothetical protein